jgi:hypothetical protein
MHRASHDWNAYEKHARAVLRIVAPEYLGVPIYLHRAKGDQVYGLTSGAHDIRACGATVTTRGFGASYCPRTICRNDARDAVLTSFVATALHEFAHALQYRYLLPANLAITSVPLSEERAAAYTASVRRMSETPRKLTLAEFADEVRYQFFMHDDRFLRAALHLRRRAVLMAGEKRMSASRVIGQRLSGTHPDLYDRALGDEPARLIGDPLAAILDTPAPEAFTNLWQSDVERLDRQYPERTSL